MTSTSSGMNVYVAAAGHSFVSQSGLVAVLKAVRKHGLPDAISRPTLKRRRADAIPQETPVGPLWGSIQLLCEGNSLLQLPVCNPYALLYVTLENCRPFREYFESVLYNSVQYNLLLRRNLTRRPVKGYKHEEDGGLVLEYIRLQRAVGAGGTMVPIDLLQNRPCEEGAGAILTNLETHMQTLSISTFGWKTWHSFAIGWILLSYVLQGPGPFGRRSGIETVLEQQRILWNLHLHILSKCHKPLVGFGSS